VLTFGKYDVSEEEAEQALAEEGSTLKAWMGTIVGPAQPTTHTKGT
jgi:hypothetical protein